MIKQLQDLIQDFPIQDNLDIHHQFFLLKDTYYVSGNIVISSLLNYYLKQNKKITFVGIQQNYAHYLNTSKKLGQSIEQAVNKSIIQYIDLFQEIISDWIPQDLLPFTDVGLSSINWSSVPKNVKILKIQQSEEDFLNQLYTEIEQNILQKQTEIVIIDNLTHLYNLISKKELLYSFFTSLYQLTLDHKINLFILATLVIDVNLFKLVTIFENYATVLLEIFQMPSGYSKDIYGQIIVKHKENIQKFLMDVNENSIKLVKSLEKI